VLERILTVEKTSMRRRIPSSQQSRKGLRAKALCRAFRAQVEAMEFRQLLAPLMVTNTNDNGTGSLRAAILTANLTAGHVFIDFAIPGSGTQTISLATVLPKITAQVTIDGTTQTGFSGTPLIELDGTSVTSGDGLYLAGGNSTVEGLVINRFGGNGIKIDTAGGDIIQGNYIGTDILGTTAEGNSADGISIGSYNNTIGGLTAATRNVISGNKSHGVHFDGAFSNAPVMNNLVEGNYIGVSVNGSQPLGNGGNGVDFFGGTLNTIGGTASGAGNVISKNGTGIKFFAGGSGHNLVEGNFIGTDPTGTLPMGNTFDGINVQSADAVTIGGTAAGAGNVISANKGNGIGWFGGQILELVEGNKIGTDITGTQPLGNLGAGLSEGAGSKQSQSTIGGTAAGAANIIAYNGATFTDSGVDISAATGVAILSNSIYSNLALGINLVASGDPSNKVTPNTPGGPHSGPNDLQNYPVLSSAASGGGHTIVAGTLNSTPNHMFLIQFFADPTADPTGHGQGQTYLGSTTVMTDNTDNASFNVILPTGAAVGSVVSSTATDITLVNAIPVNDTSEFSQDVPVTQAPLADMAVGIAAAPEPVAVGTNLTYTVTATNNGPNDATGVTLTDTLPAGVTYVMASVSQGSFIHSGNTVTANFGGVANGTAPTLTIVIQPTAAGTLTDSATVSANEIDPNSSNNSTTHNTQAQVLVDLGVGITASPEPAKTVRNLTYTVTVMNNGPDASTGSALTDTLPAGVTFVSASVSQGTFMHSGSSVSATFGAVANGGTAVLTIVVTPTVTGQITDSASVVGNETDPVALNNSAMHTTQVNASVADLALGMMASPEPVTLGNNLTYTLTVTNAGPDDATGTVLTDTLPSGVTFVSATPSQGTFMHSGNTVTANLGGLALNGTATLTIVITPTAPGSVTNMASVTANESDPTPNDNSVSHMTTVNDAPGFLQFSSATYAVQENGGSVTITVTRTLGTLAGVSVNYATSDGTAHANVNYVPASGTLNFGAGDTSKSFMISVIDDHKFVGNQTVNLTLSMPGGGASIGTPSTASLTIGEVDHRTVPGDFDGDGKTDTAAYDQTTATFYELFSGGGAKIYQFGNAAHTNIPIAGDFDGDGKTDTAAYDQTTATFYELFSGGGAKIYQFGNPAHTNIPIAGDFDGDGKTDTAAYDQTTSTFYVLFSGGGAKIFQFGNPAHTNIPIAGDFDGAGKTDFAIYDQTTATFSVLLSGGTTRTVQFGNPADKNVPIPGDFDGDGKTDFAAYDQTTSTFYELFSGGGAKIYQFGNPAHTNIPLYGDYDGDGKTDTAVYDQTTATFYELFSGGGARIYQFGDANHTNVPIPAAYAPPSLRVSRFAGFQGGSFGSTTNASIALLPLAGPTTRSAIAGGSLTNGDLFVVIPQTGAAQSSDTWLAQLATTSKAPRRQPLVHYDVALERLAAEGLDGLL